MLEKRHYSDKLFYIKYFYFVGVRVMTIKELADLAGVSPATISNVLNGKKGVSEEKRKEILRLAEETKYQHQKKEETQAKRVLFIKFSKHGKLVEENTGFISGIMDGAEAECQKRNIVFSIKACKGNIGETLQSLDYASLLGLIVLGTELDDGDYPALDAIPIPYVVVDNSMPHFDCNTVYINNKESVFKVIQYFAKKDFKHIQYFKNNYKVQNTMEREAGFREACEHFGIEINEDEVFSVPPTMLGAFEQTQKYLEEGHRFHGCIFVDNDTMTIGVMKALMIAGYEIPEDVSVVGFDNIPFSEIYSPTISTIDINKHELGKAAIISLLKTIESSEYRNAKLAFTGNLLIRQSTV